MAVPNMNFSYLKNGSWHSFTGKVQSAMDGIKIQTGANSSYYLQYRTRNQGKTDFYSFVKSNVNDFAGVAGRPVQLLQIQAYKNDGTKLTSGVVVMYRVSISGRWLPWVSNAEPAWMESVHKKYNLDGALDTDSYYAGNAGQNIDGVEIQVYEEGSIGDFTGGEVSPTLSTMTGSLSNWTGFEKSAFGSQFDGIKIQTSPSKDYYLEYRTKNAGNSDYYSAVKSTGTAYNDYAGYPGKPIQLLSILAYKNDGTRLRSGVIVMYRVAVEGRWLPWVSNADPQWMRDAKNKYGLDGVLDTQSTYAGNEGETINGVEIRVFEDDSSDPGMDDFTGSERMTVLQHMSGSLSSWTGFSKKVSGVNIDGIKIFTSVSDSYYLGYQSKNQGNSSYYPEVKSTGTAYNDYAGYPGKPMQLLKISAYAKDGTRLRSGVVVMYRVSIKGRWLPWVSNAGLDWMRSVQSQYNLGGTLDAESGYAGNDGENIDGVEIHVYEGVRNDDPVGELPGAEYAPGLSYMVDGLSNWKSFRQSVQVSRIDGVKIQTDKSKPYYLSYKSKNAGNRDYYPEVKSTGTAYNDYAGYPGKAMQLLRISVYSNSGVKLKTGVVVMYRVHVDNRWLPWVSNAEPAWMRKVHSKYKLDGKLDTDGYYAGNEGQNINGVEVRIFEESDLNIPSPTPSGKQKIIRDVPFLRQYPHYPTGCESVTAVMALNYAGVFIMVNTFIDKYLDKKLNGVPFDPNVHFGGNPRNGSSYGCYAPVIKKALDKILSKEKLHAEVLSGVSLPSLCSEFIDKNIPVILWATSDMRTPYKNGTWTYNLKKIQWISPMHCLLLVGYDENYYYFNDPQKNQPLMYYRKEVVEEAYQGLFQQAIVLLREGNVVPPSVYKYGAVENPVTKEIYPIHIEENGKDYSEPLYVRELNSAEKKPTQMRKVTFNAAKFFSGLELDGTFNNASKYPLTGGTLGNLFAGIGSVGENLDSLYIDVDYYKVSATGQKRAVVRCGESSRIQKLKNWKFKDTPVSFKSIIIWDNPDTPTMEAWKAVVDKHAKREYGMFKGITPNDNYKYDFDITVSKKREAGKYLTQIFMAEDGKMYEYATLYDNEKFEIVVTRPGILKDEEVDRLDITPLLSPLSLIPAEKAALFNVKII